MKLRSDLFPYPVLSNELDDFSNGKFNVSISQKKISVSRFLITFDFQLENEDLQNLILEKKSKICNSFRGKIFFLSKFYIFRKWRNYKGS